MIIEQVEAACTTHSPTPYAAPPTLQRLRERAAALRSCCERRTG